MTRRREQLVSPLALVLLSLGFAAAFAVLSPAFNNADDSDAPLDGLSVAYLKASAGADALDDTDAYRAMLELARSNQIESLEVLRQSNAHLSLDAGRRLMLDVEIRAARHRVASGELRDVERLQFDRSVVTFVDQPEWHSVNRLARVAELSLQLNDGYRTADVYRLLAARDTANTTLWHARCARVLADVSGDASAAVQCLDAAFASAQDRAQRFSLGLDMLALKPRDTAVLRALLTDADATVVERQQLAKALLAMERPLDAASVYAELAEVDAHSRVIWMREAARWAEAAARPAVAAVYLDSISTDVPDAERKTHLARIEALLLGAGDVQAAARALDARLDQTPADADLLRQAIVLAQQSNNLEQAFVRNSELLALEPDDGVAWSRQHELALALGHLETAHAAAARAVALDESNVEKRVVLAKTSEWTGDPEQALTHWRQIVAREPTVPHLEELTRLAEMLRYPALAADAQLAMARLQAPSPGRTSRIVQLYELDGRPQVAADALQDIMQRHGDTAHALRELAALHTRHSQYESALKAWDRFAARFGRTSEETLARMELNWRLSNTDAAVAVAGALVDMGVSGEVSPYQASLLSRIAWQNRLPALSVVARPLLSDIKDNDQRALHGRHAIETLVADGKPRQARTLAESLWRESGDDDFALMALRLAADHEELETNRRLLDETVSAESLRVEPEYWSLKATVELREGDALAAERSYRTALGIDADNGEAIGGLLWLLIGRGDSPEKIERLLAAHDTVAMAQPDLAMAFAVAHLQLGAADDSLGWFQRALPSAQNDYGFLLTYADALEASGQVDRALKARRYALRTLRPRLFQGVGKVHDAALQQYGQVLARYGSADDNEAWMNFVLNTMLEPGGNAGFWREDMAIAWLMATERYEHARVVMARLHERRLQTPVWQDMALALRADDRDSIDAMLKTGSGLSDGNRILALRRVGREDEAFALALRTLDAPRTAQDRAIALDQYTSFIRRRPNDITVGTGTRFLGDFRTRETRFAARHTFGRKPGSGSSPAVLSGVGFGIDVVQRNFDSPRFDLSEQDSESEIALSLFRETDTRSARLQVGLLNTESDTRSWATAYLAGRDWQGRRELGLDVGFQETADESPELRLAGQRNRIGLALESAVGKDYFSRVGAEATEFQERISGERFARGLRTRAEFGVRGATGPVAWSSSVSAENVANDRVEQLPAALRISPTSTLDGVLVEQASALSLNGSVSRGGAGDEFRASTSPRFFLNAGVGHAWPNRAFGLQLDAGAGVRVLGNDELGFRLSRGSRLGTNLEDADSTRVAVDYRYRF